MGPVVRGFVKKKDRSGTPSQLPLVICWISEGIKVFLLGGEFYKGATFRKKSFAILGGVTGKVGEFLVKVDT